MAWRDDLQPASFRGVPFEVEDASQQGGRRLAKHEYPKSELVELEDIGQGEGRFTIEGFVIGDDYFRLRDALIDALELPGSGTLVHPYRGQRKVAVETWLCDEGKREGRCATFRITFIRDEGIRKPSTSTDTQAATRTAAGEANAAAAGQFADGLVIANDADRGYSLQVLEDSLAPVAKAIQTVRTTADRVQLQLLSALLDPIAGSRRILSDLLGAPGDLADRIQGLIGNITTAGDLSTLFERRTSVRVPPGNPAGNLAAIETLLQTSIAIQQAALTADAEYASYDDAIAAQAAITEQLDTVSYLAGDGTYAQLQTLRTAVATDLKTRAADLARIAAFTPQETLPALVIAHRLYGPAGVAERADEICARNKIEHPGFVAGGKTLEVLTP